MKNKTKNKKNILPITPEVEQKMRILANLIIDRIFEDKQKNTLKFKSD